MHAQVAAYQQRLAKMASEVARGPLARLSPGAELGEVVQV